MDAASKKLNELKKISFEQIEENFTEDVLLYIKNKTLKYKNDRVYSEVDKNLKDLLRIIHIIEPLTLKYQETKILMPRVFAESHNPIPQHISVQCLVFHKLYKANIAEFKSMVHNLRYQKTSYDNAWIGVNQKLNNLKENDIVYIMNRRVGGWDGSLEKPVIELLCAGGHLPTIWNEESKCFETLQPIELLQKEFKEKLGLSISKEQFIASFLDFKQLKEAACFR